MSRPQDTNHRWLVWRQPAFGNEFVFAAFDDRASAEAIALLDPFLTVKEHMAWLPTTTVRVLRDDAPDVGVGQMFPPDGQILVCGSEPAGRGMVVHVDEEEIVVAVPVLAPSRGEGPSIWELRQSLVVTA